MLTWTRPPKYGKWRRIYREGGGSGQPVSYLLSNQPSPELYPLPPTLSPIPAPTMIPKEPSATETKFKKSPSRLLPPPTTAALPLKKGKKMKKKRKVHPSPPSPSLLPQSASPSSSSPSSCTNKYIISRLKLIPSPSLRNSAFSLPVQDREVLAYLITRSLNTAMAHLTTPTTVFTDSRRTNGGRRATQPNSDHKKFSCDCFDCYASFWSRWDSSPNRDIIDRVIEAYDDHLNEIEKSTYTSGGATAAGGGGSQPNLSPSPAKACKEITSTGPESEAEIAHPLVEEGWKGEIRASRFSNSPYRVRGFARKVLPDVLGLLNWRFWRLWNAAI